MPFRLQSHTFTTSIVGAEVTGPVTAMSAFLDGIRSWDRWSDDRPTRLN